MPAASILIKPASANCNMDCKYCFYKCLSSHREEYSKGFMKEETLETLVREAIAYADGSLTFAFQGGEPTLAGLDFFQKAVELQQKYNNKKLQIENTIQTNGLLIDEKWARFLGEHRFLVGLSLDGPKKMHDRYRKDAGGQDTFARIMHSVQLLEQYQVDYNVVTVVTNDTAKQASFLYKFWKRNHYPFVQFIPCMDEIKRQDGTQERSIYAVESEQYGKFLCELFDLWYADFAAGETMDIRMFSNLAQMAAGYPAEECGMNGCCNCYFVVEGDGSVYPCDFYCMDEWKLGTVNDGFVQMKTSEKAKAFVEASRPVCAACQECPHFSLCRGGCRRWREPFVDGKPGLNQLCSAYRMFFAHAAERMERLGVYIRQKYAGSGK
jgi:uncharacterized protein